MVGVKERMLNPILVSLDSVQNSAHVGCTFMHVFSSYWKVVA